MKRLYILAALLLATTSAQAGNSISFQINGERIRVEAPRNCNALSCIRITAPGYSGTVGNIDLKGIGSKNKDDDDFADTSPAKPAPASAPAPVQAAAPQPAAPAATYVGPAPAPTAVASAAPAQVDVAAPAPAPVAVAAPVVQPAPVAAAPVSDPNSPLGVWATEENKGNVRIEQCGANLCGYSVKSGDKILISMKPEGSKWTGRIHDPDSGRNYDSTMAMKGTTSLRVQGCAFGGMFCGGQTWKRVS
ncbi:MULTISPECIES: DUF2147 domain-containing protein [Bradyrhizobium]|uniref:Uncharacterized conserved protein, DUF2147 family n=2 Tax=Bradyrhizobium TaxID=374 RepID=A0ABY0Q235_9BRAD|nr:MULTISPECIES: DUF2147 domain-containing protein [Bradyrhizobium]SDJ37266.1 Uncharacterized conserved protein, DUF2147 family [Bradyrhizobium ottawaense]SEC63622.1 Uncharacterized conserved protein, DUF2147 family [Bradyrhizobium lablabi]SHK79950.1 Uncharacterized conserved protein, DUF2147 family [Bradyrhizobium lablabi]